MLLLWCPSWTNDSQTEPQKMGVLCWCGKHTQDAWFIRKKDSSDLRWLVQIITLTSKKHQTHIEDDPLTTKLPTSLLLSLYLLSTFFLDVRLCNKTISKHCCISDVRNVALPMYFATWFTSGRRQMGESVQDCNPTKNSYQRPWCRSNLPL